MFQAGTSADHEPTSGIDLSIKLVQTLLQQTIEQTVIRKTGKRNGVGLLLYNTKTTRENNGGKNENADNEDNESDDDDDKMDDDDDDDDEEMDDESTVDGDRASPQHIETTVHRLLDLKPPGIKHVQTLRKILVDKRRQQQKSELDLKADFCPSLDDPEPSIAPLQTALEEAQRMFLSAKCVRDSSKNRKGKDESDTKSIWIFTNQANPCSDEKNQLIQNIANEAKEQRIRIIVWPLIDPTQGKTTTVESEEEFESPFFDSIVSEVLFDDRLRSFVDLQDGLEGIYRSLAKKRRMYYGPMHILRPGTNVGNNRSIEDPAIMIDWYSVVQLSRKPGKVAIDTASKRETVNIRMVLEKDTGKEVAKFWNKPTPEQREFQQSQISIQRFRQFSNFANELVPITPSDMKKMNTNANGGYAPGLTILGFKPIDSIPWYHSISKAFIIFPNETDVKGSENAFLQLHAAMLRKKVLAVGEALQRETSQSRLVAVYPFEETDHLPPGMYVKTLPFEDDMRRLVPDAASAELDLQQKKFTCKVDIGDPDKPGSSLDFVEDALFSGSSEKDYVTGSIASEKLIQAATNLMNRQTISSAEIGEDFENAALTEFYSYLKSVAFDTAKEENNYDTIVNKDAILKIAGEQIDAYRSSLPVDIERPKASTSRKRTKKLVPDDSGIDWFELFRMNEIGSCKVDQLKKYLRSVGLSTVGRKDDLIDRIEKSLEKRVADDGNVKQDSKGIDPEKNLIASI